MLTKTKIFPWKKGEWAHNNPLFLRKFDPALETKNPLWLSDLDDIAGSDEEIIKKIVREHAEEGG